MREQLAKSLRLEAKASNLLGSNKGKVSVQENVLDRLFEIEPAEDPPCCHGTVTLPDGWQEDLVELNLIRANQAIAARHQN